MIFPGIVSSYDLVGRGDYYSIVQICIGTAGLLHVERNKPVHVVLTFTCMCASPSFRGVCVCVCGGGGGGVGRECGTEILCFHCISLSQLCNTC